MTHAALLSGKWKNIYANDLDGRGLRLFLGAANGVYKDEVRWISREDFFRLKETDPYIAMCWSFGNNFCNYLYPKEIEPWKRALHWARVYNDLSVFRATGGQYRWHKNRHHCTQRRVQSRLYQMVSCATRRPDAITVCDDANQGTDKADE